jgi:glycerol-3-phosphate cytidylyltransferase
MKRVITYGTFDLFHEGHSRLLERAKALGDYLIVGITSDYFDLQRGKMNIEQSLLERVENVRKSGFADLIIVEEHEAQKIDDIQKYNVDIFTVGSDWHEKFDYLKKYCEVVYLDRTPKISSTRLRKGRHGIVRLGFIGTGRIAERQAHELKFISGAERTAIFNPNMQSAEAFTKKHDFAGAFYDYEAFLEEVDAVYVASPHATHFDYTKRALNAGKHVLCEKPMVLSEKEAVALFDIAKQKKVVLMEAIRTAYAPGFINLLAIAKSGRIGEIKDVETSVTKLLPRENNARVYDPDVGGSFTELASSTLLPIIKLLGKNYTSLHFEFFNDENNIDIYAKAHFKFDGAVATSKTGIGVKSEGQLLISGTKGYILAKSPWWLTKSFEVCYEDTKENEHFSAPFPDYGMRFELAEFIKNIREPKSINYKLSRSDSITLAKIMECFLRARKNTPSI